MIRYLSCSEGHYNYTIPRVQSPEIMQSRHDPIEGQLSRAGETRQPEKKKEKAGRGVESGDVATAHCLHSFGKRQRAEPPPAVCLQCLQPLSATSFTHTRTFVCFHALSITASYLHDTSETDLFLNIFRSLS